MTINEMNALETAIMEATSPLGWSKLHLVRRVTTSVRIGLISSPAKSIDITAAVDTDWRGDMRTEVINVIVSTINTFEVAV